MKKYKFLARMMMAGQVLETLIEDGVFSVTRRLRSDVVTDWKKTRNAANVTKYLLKQVI